jgi:uncharacterized protein YndB with AHSA1/START domain
MTAADGRDDTIVQEITIRAPAARVFAALTDPQQRMQWWGAEGLYRATHMESDLRPGGKWSTRGTGFGKSFRVHGEYREIDAPRTLAFTWIPDWQPDASESLVRFDLTEKDGVTTVRLTHSGLTPEARQAHRGWPQVLGWLKAWLEAA